MTDCPVCRRPGLALRFRVRPPAHLGIAETYDLLRCPACRFQATFPRPGREALEKAYGPDFHNTAQQHVPLDDDGTIGRRAETRAVLRNARRRVEWLARWRAGGSLLDVGCGKGVFVHAAGARFSAEGIDLSPHAVAWGTAAGLRLRAGDFLAEPIPGAGALDVVTMWDVLACLPDPRAALDRVAGLLKPGGLFAATFPDAASWASRLLGRRWPLMIPPINISFPTARTVEVLAEACGFRVVCRRHRGKLLDLRFALLKLKRMLGLHPENPKVASSGRGRNVYLNLFDILTVLLRKT